MEVLAMIVAIITTVEALILGGSAFLEKAWRAGGGICFLILIICLFTFAQNGIVLLIIDVIVGFCFYQFHPRNWNEGKKRH